MPDYSFESIDAKIFEHLAVALGQVHIARGLRPFGPGPDGGREATFEGRMDYPAGAAPWDGYLVVQCKRKESRASTPKDEADWAIAQLDDEMQKYSVAKVPRRLPEYFLFITNAELSAKPNDGGKDRFVARLDHWVATLGIRAADFWDREKLSRLLDGTQVVAQRFGLLHAGDLVHYAAQKVLNHRTGIEATLSLYLQEELRVDQYVRLAQAGHVGDERTPLARVFVDLRATTGETSGASHLVVNAVQSASDRPVYPSLVERERDAEAQRQKDGAVQTQRGWSDPSRFVVVGGPGQGKSTLVQHLAQRYRAALLGRHSSASLNYEVSGTLRVIRESAEASGIGLPSHPRFPFRIVLEEFADALAKDETVSVLDFIARIVRKRTHRPFERDDAEQLLQQIPWFVAFDGLDEVPAVSNRSDVLTAVRLFLGEARALDADLLVMATTRPQGYEDEFSPAYFNHLFLTPLTVDEALEYARKFVATKYATDSDRRERVINRLESATKEDATARLMVSPLQVTIMSALVDLVGNPPRERYPLFERYYEVVYQREQERGLGSSEALAEHRADINALHDRAGLLLQIATETAGQAKGRLSGQRLRELVRERLGNIGYEGHDLDRITDSLIQTAINRLVFIVPLEEDQYGFEVRSLQEFAAARGLMRRGTPEQLKQRLLAIAPLPYWRNTILFAVGFVFTEREDLSDTIAQLCRELNEDEEDPALFHSRAGSRLALDILRDGVVDRRPAHRRSLLETALLLLDLPEPDIAEQLANMYRPEDEGRYAAAARSAVTRGHGDGAAVFALLALLANQHVAWAASLLAELWPIDVPGASWAFEFAAKYLLWDDWQVDSAVRVARENSPSWVAKNLSSFVPVLWIQDSAHIISSRPNRITVMLDCDEETMHYEPVTFFHSPEVLSRITAANPTHPGWNVYICCHSFFTNPGPDTLADGLMALSVFPRPDRWSADLPWPLSVILEYVESPSQLSALSIKARLGEFGDDHTWRAAEERWENRGFSPEDLVISPNSEQPFTSAIAERGMIPAPVMMSHSSRGIRRSIEGLKTAVSLCRFERIRTQLSDDLAFLINVAVHGNGHIDDVTVTELAGIAQRSSRWIDALIVAAVASSNPVINVSEAEITILGNHIRVPGTRGRFIRKTGAVSGSYRGSLSVMTNYVVGILETAGASDATVRLLAGLAFFGAEIPTFQIDPAVLTMHGQVGLVALNVITDGAAGFTPQNVVDLIAQLVANGCPIAPDTELFMSIGAIYQSRISSYGAQVLDILLRRHLLGRELAKEVNTAFASSLQYRTSQLGNAERRAILGL
jgi:hypothetical protein